MNESAIEVEDQRAPTWAPVDVAERSEVSDWRAVDRALRSIARRQAALDAEEARCLGSRGRRNTTMSFRLYVETLTWAWQ